MLAQDNAISCDHRVVDFKLQNYIISISFWYNINWSNFQRFFIPPDILCFVLSMEVCCCWKIELHIFPVSRMKCSGCMYTEETIILIFIIHSSAIFNIYWHQGWYLSHLKFLSSEAIVETIIYSQVYAGVQFLLNIFAPFKEFLYL